MPVERSMWTQRQLEDDLTDIGLSSGSAVLVHASVEAIGPIEGGAETLVAAIRQVLGAEGTLLVPTFAFDPTTPFDYTLPRSAESAGETPLNQPGPAGRIGAASPWYGTSGFADAVQSQPDAVRSEHPAFAFAAIGREAEALTSHVPFHYPLGSDGPLARLHQRNGWILLIGVGHTVNMSLHLAEIWANVPYVHRSTLLKMPTGEETMMLGSPHCRNGFARIEPLLRQSRILRRGYIGNAESQLMRQQQTVSMAVAMLQGSASALLCDDPSCRACTLARRMTSEQVVEPI
ncbi:MAG: Aminoglycoside N3-acetyltransferase [Chthonomonadaceae bacterium]|nr:Aminoglycoside N3-acetyltransferase [Chthonomonadaceae bacterium]